MTAIRPSDQTTLEALELAKLRMDRNAQMEADPNILARMARIINSEVHQTMPSLDPSFQVVVGRGKRVVRNGEIEWRGPLAAKLGDRWLMNYPWPTEDAGE